jgi:hypothetical protein
VLSGWRHLRSRCCAEFNQLAALIGTPTENIQQTLAALVQVGCVKLDSDKIVVTDLGREYISKGMKFGNG